jgi:hypothetical protein
MVRAGWRATIALAVVGAVTMIGVAATAGSPSGNVTVCHHTGSSTNPFVTIHPSASGAYHGHLQHSGDVIPPFAYQGNTYSLNWPSSEIDVVNGECVAVSAPPPSQPPGQEQPPEVEPKPPIVNTPPFTG